MVVIWGTHQDRNDFNDYFPGGQDQSTPPSTKLSVIDFKTGRWGKSEIVDYRTGRRADLSHWDGINQIVDGYYGWKLFIPETYEIMLGTYMNILQLHVGGGTGQYLRLVIDDDYTFYVAGMDKNGNAYQLIKHLDMPQNKIFTVIAHLITAPKAYLTLTIDGVIVFDNYIGKDFGNPRKPGPAIMVGCYQPLNQAGNHYILFKDVVAATTLDEVLVWLEYSDIPPDDDDDPIIIKRSVCLLSFFLDIDGIRFIIKPDSPITFTLTKADD